MNLTFHIIKKDLRRMVWALAVWATCGVYLVISSKFGAQTMSVWDNLKIVAIFSYAMLSFALVAGIVQEDGLTESDVFWRTRPTSARRMLTAKLSLLVTLFLVVPLGTIFLSKYADSGKLELTFRDICYIVLMVMSLMLSSAAIASCTKDLVRYVLIGALCLIACTVLSAFLSRYTTPLPLKMRSTVGMARAVAVALLCLGISMLVIANQYLGRSKRLEVSQGLLAAAVIGSALISTFWNWDFLSR